MIRKKARLGPKATLWPRPICQKGSEATQLCPKKAFALQFAQTICSSSLEGQQKIPLMNLWTLRVFAPKFLELLLNYFPEHCWTSLGSAWRLKIFRAHAGGAESILAVPAALEKISVRKIKMQKKLTQIFLEHSIKTVDVFGTTFSAKHISVGPL